MNKTGTAWTRSTLDDGGMAGAGCAAADLNGDDGLSRVHRYGDGQSQVV
ncbi:MAG: hypothetical protein ABI442_10885 [Gemmatimonadaceae bacterium]